MKGVPAVAYYVSCLSIGLAIAFGAALQARADAAPYEEINFACLFCTGGACPPNAACSGTGCPCSCLKKLYGVYTCALF